jgi:hypothetical protein
LRARSPTPPPRGRGLARDWSLPLRARTPRIHLEPADWRAGFLKVGEERELPVQLHQDLRERMPQALLRDLYRPVYEDRYIEREIVEGTTDRGAFSAMQEARAARTLPTLPQVEPALRTMVALQRWRRAFLAERWQPLRRDDERKSPSGH